MGAIAMVMPLTSSTLMFWMSCLPCVQVIERLRVLVTSMPKADGEIEEIKDFCKGDFGRTMRVEA